ncbi:MAG: metallophosphoesterase [Desulfurococcales archaeon]|nr:metallophosphoesterase [Desulfurococcales archaeon]
MEGKTALVLAILLLLGIQFYTITSSNTPATTETVLNETSRNVPGDLPWYPIVIFGDNRPEVEVSNGFTPVFLKILNQTEVMDPFAMIGTGDQIGRGTPWQFKALYSLLSNTSIWNIWLCIGNHDIQYGGAIGYWTSLIAPKHYNMDTFPGWRIAVLDGETGDATYWKSQLDNTTKNLDDRSLILVYHRPVIPNVGHNMDATRASILLSFLQQHPGLVKLVLQGHWHGYAVTRSYNVTWIITGGAGAPLYENRGPPPGNNTLIITGKNHYLLLILYPNGTFKYTTVLVNNESNIGIEKHTKVTLENGKTVITGTVSNTLVNIEGKPISVPVRFNLINNENSYIVLMANPNSTTSFTYEQSLTSVSVKTASTSWYAYITLPGNKAVLLDQNNPSYVIESEKSTSSTLVVTEETVTNARTTGNTSLSSTSSAPNPAAYKDKDGMIIGSVAVAILLVIAIYLMAKLYR